MTKQKKDNDLSEFYHGIDINKLIRNSMTGSFGLRDKSHKSICSVVGDPSNFYIFINTENKEFKPWSGDINDINVYHELKRVFKKDKNNFALNCKNLYNKHKVTWG